jgi:hypothetical protein
MPSSTPQDPLRVETRVITPLEAMQILQKNPQNRSIRKQKIDAFARDMKSKRWKTNGESLKFREDDSLMDGQHRLLACVQADTSFETLCIYGLDDDLHYTIDTGSARTLSDELAFRGETQTTNLSSILNLVWHYDHDTLAKLAYVTRSDVLELLNNEPNIRNTVASVHIGKKIGVLASALGAALHIMQREHGEKVMNQFLNELKAGVGYVDGDPCLALRNYAIKASNNRKYRPNRVEWMAVIIKTMNAWLLGRPIATVRWRRFGANKESFPKLISKEDVGDSFFVEDTDENSTRDTEL